MAAGCMLLLKPRQLPR